MKIIYSHANGAKADIPKGDWIARHAVDAYSFSLNTPERVNRDHSGPEFAAAIREAVDCESNPQNAFVADHLDTI